MSERKVSQDILGSIQVLLSIVIAACIGWVVLIDIAIRQIFPQGLVPIWFLILFGSIPFCVALGGIFHLLNFNQEFHVLSIIPILLHLYTWIVALACIPTTGKLIIFHIVLLLFAVADVLVSADTSLQFVMAIIACVFGIFTCISVPDGIPSLTETALKQSTKSYWQTWLDSEYSDTWWGNLITNAVEIKLMKDKPLSRTEPGQVS